MTSNQRSEPARPQRPTARNPRTTARFKRESWWQITFPVLAVTVVLLGGVVALALLSGPLGASIVADYSLILLILLNLIAGVIVLLVFVGLIYGVMVLLRVIPPYAYIAQKSVQGVHDRVNKVMSTITGAFISVISVLSGFTLFLRQKGILVEEEQAPSSTAQPKPGTGSD